MLPSEQCNPIPGQERTVYCGDAVRSRPGPLLAAAPRLLIVGGLALGALLLAGAQPGLAQSADVGALKADIQALCAGDQGECWDIHDLFFQDPRKLGRRDLRAHAEGLGLDMASFEECLEGGNYTARVQKDLADGVKAGVRGTPSFFLGRTDPEDSTKIRATKSFYGAQPYIVFKQTIDELVAEAAKGS